MWTFNNLPRAEIKKRYGFEVTDEWVRKVESAAAAPGMHADVVTLYQGGMYNLYVYRRYLEAVPLCLRG